MTRRGLSVDGSQASIRFKNQLLTFQVGCCAYTNSLYIHFDSGYSPEGLFALISPDNAKNADCNGIQQGETIQRDSRAK
jgi:hypothetical protein